MSPYTVKAGDTLARIAQQHGVTLAALRQANPQIVTPDLIRPGQTINVPDPTPDRGPGQAADILPQSGRTYTVQPGDSMARIAQRQGVTLAALIQANPQVTDVSRIHPGQVLTIPGSGSGAGPSGAAPAPPAPPPAPEHPTLDRGPGQAPGIGLRPLTVEQLRRIVPALRADRATPLMAPLNQAMAERGITTPARQAAFLAQIAHETGGFKWFRELGNDAYFRRYDGRADLGNVQPGDGPRYRGRGFIQITGRANYTRAGRELGLDLVHRPELAETPEVGARIAAWFWDSHGLNALADRADHESFRTITRRINGGLNGLTDRLAYYARAKSALGVA